MNFTDKLHKTFDIINFNHYYELQDFKQVMDSDIIVMKNGTWKMGLYFYRKVAGVKKEKDVAKVLRIKKEFKRIYKNEVQ